MIEYVQGDATSPESKGNKIIVHVCNDIGGWGAGFVAALSRKWSNPEQQYRGWYKSNDKFELGKVQFVQVESDTWVANMIGQHHVVPDKEGNPPIRYDAIEKGLATVTIQASVLNASVHMPRIGCGIAGGKWKLVEPLIQQTLIANGIRTVVYDFE
jgi:O-acetyl-ADP-ribose deacetylase (regulator of RNase III)